MTQKDISYYNPQTQQWETPFAHGADMVQLAQTVSNLTQTTNQKIDEVTTHLAQNQKEVANLQTEKAPLTETQRLEQIKANKTYVDGLISGITTVQPRDIYYSISALETALPNGDEGLYLVYDTSFTDGAHSFIWSASENKWKDTGVWQANGVADGSIKPTHVNSSDVTVNIFDKDNVRSGGYYVPANGNVGDDLTFTSNANWSSSPKITVKAGDKVRFNNAFMDSYFVGIDTNDKFVLRAGNVNPAGYREVTVPSGVVAFYSAVYKDYIDSAMITINETLPQDYVPHKIKKSLDWLELKPSSVEYENLSSEAVETIINQLPAPEWKDKTFLTLGDSITWQDQKPYEGTQTEARGYQTHLKEQLGFASYQNYGVSGRPMANGTANGVGTNTTGKNVTYNTDLVIIAAGTNDFKLNVPLGSVGEVGDTTFDTNTFYGAYRDLIEYILTQKPTQQIVLFTPLQRDNGQYDVTTINTAGHKLIDYVNAVKTVGQMYALPVCDMYATSGFTQKTLATYTLDGLHPDNLGYERMGRVAVNFIKNI